MNKRKSRELLAERSEEYPSQKNRDLFAAILKLKTPDEAARFFRDLLTIAEIEEFSNRWLAAKFLAKGKPYAEIAAETKMSTTTVSRVAHWLFRGLGGYELLLHRLGLSPKPHRK